SLGSRNLRALKILRALRVLRGEKLLPKLSPTNRPADPQDSVSPTPATVLWSAHPEAWARSPSLRQSHPRVHRPWSPRARLFLEAAAFAPTASREESSAASVHRWWAPRSWPPKQLRSPSQAPSSGCHPHRAEIPGGPRS